MNDNSDTINRNAAANQRWDVDALRAGASVMLMFALPATLIARFVLDTRESSSSWTPLLSLIAIMGFVLGAGVAAWQQRRNTPLAHGVVASTGTHLVVQTAIVLVKVVIGSEVRFGRVLTSVSFALVAGVIGSLLGAFVARNSPPRRQA